MFHQPPRSPQPIFARSTLIWVGNSYCDAAVSRRPRFQRTQPCIMFFGDVQNVPLLQCDHGLDYTISFRGWLQSFAHNGASHPVSISSLHCIACFVRRNQEIARSNVSIFSCDFIGNDSYNRERNIRFRRLVHSVGTREHASLGRVGSCENVSGILYPKYIVEYAGSVRHGSANNQLSATVAVIFLENSSRATGRIDSRKNPDGKTCAASSDRRWTRRSDVTQQPDSIGTLRKAMDADPSRPQRRSGNPDWRCAKMLLLWPAT
jgi:hypothetical protein